MNLRFKMAVGGLVILILFSIVSYFNLSLYAENRFEDFWYQSGQRPDSRIVIIGIDDKSLDRIGKWPWKRNTEAEIVRRIASGKPSVIGLDIIYTEKGEPAEDASLMTAVSEAGNVVLPVYADFGNTYYKAGGLVPVSLETPFEPLGQAAATGHINVLIDPDGIVRNALVKFNYQGKVINSFAWEVFKKYEENLGEKNTEVTVPVDAWNRSGFEYSGEPGTFETHSVIDVLSGKIPPEYFRDKIVLVGIRSVGMGDEYLTPLDHSAPMYGIEIHANMIEAFLEGGYKSQMPDYVNLAAVLIMGSLGLFLSWKLSPKRAFLFLVPVVAAYLAAAKILYDSGYVLQLLYPVAAGFLMYIFILAFKYISEYLERKRITGIFGRYVTPQVVGRILENGEDGLRLGGCKKEVSVLFVDIRGFTSLAENIKPEETVEILNEYLNLCSNSVFQQEGTIDKFIGDGVMAVFNAPLDLEDHAAKAVRAAWEIRRGAGDLKRKLKERYGVDVGFGIGINTGEAVVGNIGTHFRMDYTAIGDTVNTAARLENSAAAGEIRIGVRTYELVKDMVTASNLGEVFAKGKEAGIAAYRIDALEEGEQI